MVDLSSATLNSLADIFRRLQPIYTECSFIISNLAEHDRSVPAPHCAPLSATRICQPVRARKFLRTSRTDYSSGEPILVPERSMMRYNREQLYVDVWSMPRWKAAKKNGISEDTLGAVCGRLHIPTPGLGYWSKVAAGKPTKPAPLLPAVEIRTARFVARSDQELHNPIEDPHACAEVSPTDQHSLVPAGLNSRYNRDRLYAEVWTKPMRALASQYGVSDSALRKTCCRLLVPIPPQGYWNKIAAGKEVAARPELPSIQVAGFAAEKRIYSLQEQNRLLIRIRLGIATGQTLAAACRRAGISEKNYRRWYRQQPTPVPLHLRPVMICPKRRRRP
jgi:hypothetical protein